jgi:hypothetical protein
VEILILEAANMISLLTTIVAAGMTFSTAMDAQEPEEYQVKAAFLYNFAKFVEWPADAFKTPKDPIRICVLGHNPFGKNLEDLIRGKSIEGRPFELRQVSEAEEASGCHILFVGAADARRFRTAAGNIKTSGVLTVGEAQGFASSGGVVNFKIEDGRVRFEINVEAAEHQQLHISSKLLGLAEIVKAEKAP